MKDNRLVVRIAKIAGTITFLVVVGFLINLAFANFFLAIYIAFAIVAVIYLFLLYRAFAPSNPFDS